MENERFRITLDSPEKTYLGGQTVKGDIYMNLVKRVKIRAIKVQLIGKGKCKWMEILRKESMNDSARSLFYSSKEIYVHFNTSLSIFEPRGVELGVGEHTFDFAIPLEKTLPSSFKGSYGSIKYKLRIIIQKPWTFDEKHIIPINIVKYMVVPQWQHLNPTSITTQITKTISLFGNRPITLVAVLPENFGVRNKNMKLFVTVANGSNINVEKLKFSILQLITYYSQEPLRIRKDECVVIFQKETGNVQKKSERTFEHELPVPPCQPSDDALSSAINISYEVRVEAVLRGFFKNLVLTLPFKVYSEFTDNNELFPRSRCNDSNNDSGAGNPFEMNGTSITYPQMDSSMSSIGSPSHSSQMSESSSIHSTTSDSSAVTLSPAVGTGLSYASGSSSQFNSPSTRGSIRSSVVPYMPYSSSPLMVNSYPPYPVPDSPEYAMMPQPSSSMSSSARATPPTAQPLSSLSTTSFLMRRPPPGADDLPPSYEELFGNATAPPGSPK